MAAEFDDSQIRDLGNQWINTAHRLNEYLTAMHRGVESMGGGWTGKASRAARVVWDGAKPHNVYDSIFNAAWVAEQVGNAIIEYADELQKTIKEINRAHLVEALSAIFGMVLGVISMGVGSLLGRLATMVGELVESVMLGISRLASAAGAIGRAASFALDTVLNIADTLGTDVLSQLMGTKAAHAPFQVDWASEGINIGLGVVTGWGMGGVEILKAPHGVANSGSIPHISTPTTAPTPTPVDSAIPNPSGVPHTGLPSLGDLTAFPTNSVLQTNHAPPTNSGVTNPATGTPRPNAGLPGNAAPLPGNVRPTAGGPGGETPGTTRPTTPAPGSAAPNTPTGPVTTRGGGQPPNLVRDDTTPTTGTPNAFLDGPPRSTRGVPADTTTPPAAHQNGTGGKGGGGDADVRNEIPPNTEVRNEIPPNTAAAHGGGVRETIPPSTGGPTRGGGARDDAPTTATSHADDSGETVAPDTATSHAAGPDAVHAADAVAGAGAGMGRGTPAAAHGAGSAPEAVRGTGAPSRGVNAPEGAGSRPEAQPSAIAGGGTTASAAAHGAGSAPEAVRGTGAPGRGVNAPEGVVPRPEAQPSVNAGRGADVPPSGARPGGPETSGGTRAAHDTPQPSRSTGSGGGRRPAEPHGGKPEADDTVTRSQTSADAEDTAGSGRSADSLASSASETPVSRQHDVGSGSSADAGAHVGDRAVETAHGPGDRPGHDADTAAVVARDDAASTDSGAPGRQPAHTPAPEGGGKTAEWNAFKQEQDARNLPVVEAEARLENQRQDLDTAWDKAHDTFTKNDLFGGSRLARDGHEAQNAKWQWRNDITREFRAEVDRTGHVSSDAFTRIVDRAKNNAYKYLVRADQNERFTARFKEQVDAYKANRFGEGGDLPQFDGAPSKYVFDHDLQTYVKDDSKAYGYSDDGVQGPVAKLKDGADGSRPEDFTFVDGAHVDHFRDKTHDFNALEQYYIGKHEELNRILDGFVRDGDTSDGLPAHTGRQIDGLLDGVFGDIGSIATREHDIRVATGEKFDDIIKWNSRGAEALPDDFVQQVRLDFQRDLRAQHDLVFRNGDGDGPRALWDLTTTRAIDELPGRIAREHFIRGRLAEETLHAQDRFADLGEDFLAHFGEDGRQRVIGDYLDTVRNTAGRHFTERWGDTPRTGDSAPQWSDVRDDLRSTLPDRIRHEGDLQAVVGESAHAFHEILGHPGSTESFQLHEDTVSRLGNDFRTDRVVKYDQLFAPEGHKTHAWLSHESHHEDAFQSRLGDLRDGDYYSDISSLSYPAFRDWRTAVPARGESTPARPATPEHPTAPEGHTPVPEGHTSTPEGPTPAPAGRTPTPADDVDIPVPPREHTGGLQETPAVPTSQNHQGPAAGSRTRTQADHTPQRQDQAQVQLTPVRDTAGSPGTLSHTSDATVPTSTSATTHRPAEQGHGRAQPSRQDDSLTEDLPGEVHRWLRNSSDYTFTRTQIDDAHQELLQARPGLADLPVKTQATLVGQTLVRSIDQTVRAATDLLTRYTGVYPDSRRVQEVHQQLSEQFGTEFRQLTPVRQADVVVARMLDQRAGLHNPAAAHGAPEDLVLPSVPAEAPGRPATGSAAATHAGDEDLVLPSVPTEVPGRPGTGSAAATHAGDEDLVLPSVPTHMPERSPIERAPSAPTEAPGALVGATVRAYVEKLDGVAKDAGMSAADRTRYRDAISGAVKAGDYRGAAAQYREFHDRAEVATVNRRFEAFQEHVDQGFDRFEQLGVDRDAWQAKVDAVHDARGTYDLDLQDATLRDYTAFVERHVPAEVLTGKDAPRAFDASLSAALADVSNAVAAGDYVRLRDQLKDLLDLSAFQERLDALRGDLTGEEAALNARIHSADSADAAAAAVQELHDFRDRRELSDRLDALKSDAPAVTHGPDVQDIPERLDALFGVTDRREIELRGLVDDAAGPEEAAQALKNLHDYRDARDLQDLQRRLDDLRRDEPDDGSTTADVHLSEEELLERYTALRDGGNDAHAGDLRKRAYEADSFDEGARILDELHAYQDRGEKLRQQRMTELRTRIGKLTEQRETHLLNDRIAEAHRLDEELNDLRATLDDTLSLDEKRAELYSELSRTVDRPEAAGHLDRIVDKGLETSASRHGAGDGERSFEELSDLFSALPGVPQPVPHVHEGAVPGAEDPNLLDTHHPADAHTGDTHAADTHPGDTHAADTDTDTDTSVTKTDTQAPEPRVIEPGTEELTLQRPLEHSETVEAPAAPLPLGAVPTAFDRSALDSLRTEAGDETLPVPHDAVHDPAQGVRLGDRDTLSDDVLPSADHVRLETTEVPGHAVTGSGAAVHDGDEALVPSSGATHTPEHAPIEKGSSVSAEPQRGDVAATVRAHVERLDGIAKDAGMSAADRTHYRSAIDESVASGDFRGAADRYQEFRDRVEAAVTDQQLGKTLTGLQDVFGVFQGDGVTVWGAWKEAVPDVLDGGNVLSEGGLRDVGRGLRDAGRGARQFFADKSGRSLPGNRNHGDLRVPADPDAPGGLPVDVLRERDLRNMRFHRAGDGATTGVLSLHSPEDWAMRQEHWAAYSGAGGHYASMHPGALTSRREPAPWAREDRPVFYVTTHGQSDKAKSYLTSGKKKIIDAQGLSRILRRDPVFSRFAQQPTDVVLAICDAGLTRDQSLAQQLADELGVTVHAPNGRVALAPSAVHGTTLLTVFSPGSEPGQFITFTPRTTRATADETRAPSNSGLGSVELPFGRGVRTELSDEARAALEGTAGRLVEAGVRHWRQGLPLPRVRAVGYGNGEFGQGGPRAEETGALRARTVADALSAEIESRLQGVQGSKPSVQDFDIDRVSGGRVPGAADQSRRVTLEVVEGRSQVVLGGPGERPVEVAKDLHFVWLGGAMSDGARSNLRQWMVEAGRANWSVHLWTDQDAVRANADVFAGFAEAGWHVHDSVDELFSAADVNARAIVDVARGNHAFAMASDVIRYGALRRFGGVYLDVDIAPGAVRLPEEPLVMDRAGIPFFAPSIRDRKHLGVVLRMAGAEGSVGSDGAPMARAIDYQYGSGDLNNNLIVAPAGSEFVSDLLSTLRDTQAPNFPRRAEDMRQDAPQVSGPLHIKRRLEGFLGDRGQWPAESVNNGSGGRVAYATAFRRHYLAFDPAQRETWRGLDLLTDESENQEHLPPAARQDEHGTSADRSLIPEASGSGAGLHMEERVPMFDETSDAMDRGTVVDRSRAAESREAPHELYEDLRFTAGLLDDSGVAREFPAEADVSGRLLGSAQGAGTVAAGFGLGVVGGRVAGDPLSVETVEGLVAGYRGVSGDAEVRRLLDEVGGVVRGTRFAGPGSEAVYRPRTHFPMSQESPSSGGHTVYRPEGPEVTVGPMGHFEDQIATLVHELVHVSVHQSYGGAENVDQVLLNTPAELARYKAYVRSRIVRLVGLLPESGLPLGWREASRQKLVVHVGQNPQLEYDGVLAQLLIWSDLYGDVRSEFHRVVSELAGQTRVWRAAGRVTVPDVPVAGDYLAELGAAAAVPLGQPSRVRVPFAERDRGTVSHDSRGEIVALAQDVARTAVQRARRGLPLPEVTVSGYGNGAGLTAFGRGGAARAAGADRAAVVAGVFRESLREALGGQSLVRPEDVRIAEAAVGRELPSGAVAGSSRQGEQSRRAAVIEVTDPAGGYMPRAAGRGVAGDASLVRPHEGLRSAYRWLEEVNPYREQGGGFETNCVLTAIAVDLSLRDGGVHQASPSDPGAVRRGVGETTGLRNYLENYLDRVPDPVPGVEAVVAAMSAAPVGARGMVVIEDAAGAVDHVVNVTRDHNGVVFLDGQSGFPVHAPEGVVSFLPTTDGIPGHPLRSDSRTVTDGVPERLLGVNRPAAAGASGSALGSVELPFGRGVRTELSDEARAALEGTAGRLVEAGVRHWRQGLPLPRVRAVGYGNGKFGQGGPRAEETGALRARTVADALSAEIESRLQGVQGSKPSVQDFDIDRVSGGRVPGAADQSRRVTLEVVEGRSQVVLGGPGERPVEVAKDLHFVWLGGAMSDGARSNLRQWMVEAGRANWSVHLWTDQDAVRANADVFAGFAEAGWHVHDSVDELFSAADVNARAIVDVARGNHAFAMASDVIRYGALRRFGGVYLDVDIAPGAVRLPEEPLVMDRAGIPFFAPSIRDRKHLGVVLRMAGAEGSVGSDGAPMARAIDYQYGSGDLNNNLIVAPAGSEFVSDLLSTLRDTQAPNFPRRAEDMRQDAPQVSGPLHIKRRLEGFLGDRGQWPAESVNNGSGGRVAYATAFRRHYLAFDPAQRETWRGLDLLTDESENQEHLPPAARQDEHGTSADRSLIPEASGSGAGLHMEERLLGAATRRNALPVLEETSRLVQEPTPRLRPTAVVLDLDVDLPPRIDREPQSAPPFTGPVRFDDGSELPSYMTGGVGGLLPELPKDVVQRSFAFGQSSATLRGIDTVVRELGDRLNLENASRPAPVTTRGAQVGAGLLDRVSHTMRSNPQGFFGDGATFVYKAADGKTRMLEVTARPYGNWKRSASGLANPVKNDTMARSTVTSGRVNVDKTSVGLAPTAPLGPISRLYSLWGRLHVLLKFGKQVRYDQQTQLMNQTETRPADGSHIHVDDVHFEFAVKDLHGTPVGSTGRPGAQAADATAERATFHFVVRNGLVVRIADSLTTGGSTGEAVSGTLPSKMALGPDSRARMVVTEAYGPVGHIRRWAMEQTGVSAGSMAASQIGAFFSSGGFHQMSRTLNSGSVVSPLLFGGKNGDDPLGVFTVKATSRRAVLINETAAAEVRDIAQNTARNERQITRSYDVEIGGSVGPAFHAFELGGGAFSLRAQAGLTGRYGVSGSRSTLSGGSGAVKIGAQVKGAVTGVYLVEKEITVTAPPVREKPGPHGKLRKTSPRDQNREPVTETFTTWAVERLTHTEARRLAGLDTATSVGQEPKAPPYLTADEPPTLGMSRVEEFTFADGSIVRDVGGTKVTFPEHFADAVLSKVGEAYPNLVAPLRELNPRNPRFRDADHFATVLHNTLGVLDRLSHHSMATNLETMMTTGLRIDLTQSSRLSRGHRYVWVDAKLTGRRYEGTQEDLRLRFSAPGSEVVGGLQSGARAVQGGVEALVSLRDTTTDDIGRPVQLGTASVGARVGRRTESQSGYGRAATHEAMSIGTGGSHLYSYDISLSAQRGGYWRPRRWIRGLVLLNALDTQPFVFAEQESRLIPPAPRDGAQDAPGLGRVLLSVPEEHTPVAPAATTDRTVQAPEVLSARDARDLAMDTGGVLEDTAGRASTVQLMQHPHGTVSVTAAKQLTSALQDVLKEASGGSWTMTQKGATAHDAALQLTESKNLRANFDQSSASTGYRTPELHVSMPWLSRTTLLAHRTTVLPGMTALTPAVKIETETTVGGHARPVGRDGKTVTLFFGGQVGYQRTHEVGTGVTGNYALVVSPYRRDTSASTTVQRTAVSEITRKDNGLHVLAVADVRHEIAAASERIGAWAHGTGHLPASLVGASGRRLVVPDGWVGHLPEKSAYRLGVLKDGFGDVPLYTGRSWSPIPALRGQGFGSWPVNSLDSSAALRRFEEKLEPLGLSTQDLEQLRRLVSDRVGRALGREMAGPGAAVPARIGRWGWEGVGWIGRRQVRLRAQLVPVESAADGFGGLGHSVDLEEHRQAVESVQQARGRASGKLIGITVSEGAHTSDPVARSAGPTYAQTGSSTQETAQTLTDGTVRYSTVTSTQAHGEFATRYELRLELEITDTAPAAAGEAGAEGLKDQVDRWSRKVTGRRKHSIAVQADAGRLVEHFPLSLMRPDPQNAQFDPLAPPSLEAPGEPRRITPPQSLGAGGWHDVTHRGAGGKTEVKPFEMPQEGFAVRGIVGLDDLRTANTLALGAAYDASLLVPEHGPLGADLLARAKDTPLTRAGSGAAQSLEDGTSMGALTAFYEQTLTPQGYRVAGLTDRGFFGGADGSLAIYSKPDLSGARLLAVADGFKFDGAKRDVHGGGSSTTRAGAADQVLYAGPTAVSPTVGTNQINSGSGPQDVDSVTAGLAGERLSSVNVKPDKGRAFLFAVPTKWLSIAQVHHHVKGSAPVERVRSVFGNPQREPQAVETDTTVLAWVHEDVARKLGLVDDATFPTQVAESWNAVGKADKEWTAADQAYWDLRRGDAAKLASELAAAEESLKGFTGDRPHSVPTVEKALEELHALEREDEWAEPAHDGWEQVRSERIEQARATVKLARQVAAARDARDIAQRRFDHVKAELEARREYADALAQEYARVRELADRLTNWHQLQASPQGRGQITDVPEPPKAVFSPPSKVTPPKAAVSHKGKEPDRTGLPDGSGMRPLGAGDGVVALRPQEELLAEYGWLEQVNPHRAQGGDFETNCVLTAIAVDLTLGDADGAVHQAPPSKAGGDRLVADDASGLRNYLENYLDRVPDPVSGPQAVVEVMSAAPVGSRGMVVVENAAGGIGHVVNVTHDHNGVVFLDGQSGRPVHAPDGVVSLLPTTDGIPGHPLRSDSLTVTNGGSKRSLGVNRPARPESPAAQDAPLTSDTAGTPVATEAGNRGEAQEAPRRAPEDQHPDTGTTTSYVGMAFTRNDTTDTLQQRILQDRLSRLTPGTPEHTRLQNVLDTYGPSNASGAATVADTETVGGGSQGHQVFLVPFGQGQRDALSPEGLAKVAEIARTLVDVGTRNWGRGMPVPRVEVVGHGNGQFGLRRQLRADETAEMRASVTAEQLRTQIQDLLRGSGVDAPNPRYFQVTHRAAENRGGRDAEVVVEFHPRKVALGGQGADEVPKLLHFIWLGGKMRSGAEQNLAQWVDRGAASGWSVQLWTDSGARAANRNLLRALAGRGVQTGMIDGSLFARDHADDPAAADKLQRLFLFAMQNNAYTMASDIARYEILYRHGGAYLDVDIAPGDIALPTRPLSMDRGGVPLFAPELPYAETLRDTIESIDMELFESGQRVPSRTRAQELADAANWRYDRGSINNNLIVAPPRNTFLREALRNLPDSSDPKIATLAERGALSRKAAALTGPWFMREQIKRELHKDFGAGLQGHSFASMGYHAYNLAFAQKYVAFDRHHRDVWTPVAWLTEESEIRIDVPAQGPSSGGSTMSTPSGTQPTSSRSTSAGPAGRLGFDPVVRVADTSDSMREGLERALADARNAVPVDPRRVERIEAALASWSPTGTHRDGPADPVQRSSEHLGVPVQPVPFENTPAPAATAQEEAVAVHTADADRQAEAVEAPAVPHAVDKAEQAEAVDLLDLERFRARTSDPEASGSRSFSRVAAFDRMLHDYQAIDEHDHARRATALDGIVKQARSYVATTKDEFRRQVVQQMVEQAETRAALYRGQAQPQEAPAGTTEVSPTGPLGYRERVALAKREWRGPVAEEVARLEETLLEAGPGARSLVMGVVPGEQLWAVNVQGTVRWLEQSTAQATQAPQSAHATVVSIDLDPRAQLIKPDPRLLDAGDQAARFCELVVGGDLRHVV